MGPGVPSNSQRQRLEGLRIGGTPTAHEAEEIFHPGHEAVHVTRCRTGLRLLSGSVAPILLFFLSFVVAAPRKMAFPKKGVPPLFFFPGPHFAEQLGLFGQAGDQG